MPTRLIRAALLAALLSLVPTASAFGQAGVSYQVPPGNPFAERPGAAGEIWHMGLRNPWRFSFDPGTGDMWIGDVGAGAQEEVDFAPNGQGGRNYGWACREGTIAGPRSCSGDFAAPIHTYSRDSGGQAITGGYVVRNRAYAGLVGRYLYADYFAGAIRSITSSGGASDDDAAETVDGLSSFGQDASGTLYATSQGEGRVYRLTSAGGNDLDKQPIAGSYAAPTYVTSPPGDASRLFVVEQAGTIKVTAGGGAPSTFLDLTSQVRDGGERGLLSMAFAPDYGSSGRFYVFYTDTEGDLRIEEFRRSPDPARADPGTRRTVLVVDHSNAGNHNGGQLQFGPDGLLYIATGDGGRQGDPGDAPGSEAFGDAQSTSSLLGKILRIDPLPPGGSAGRDTTPPLLRTKVSRRQRVLRQGGVVAYARCATEACRVGFSATLRIGKRRYKLRYANTAAGTNRRVKLRARLTGRSKRALKSALRRKRRATVRVALRARDGAGNRSPLRRATVRVRR